MRFRQFAVLLFTFLLPVCCASPASAQFCRWAGTAPYCDGSCGHGETEITRLDTWPGFWTPPIGNPASNNFGSACALGSKVLCCPSPGVSCRWDGTAPFCSGSCRAGERASQPPPGSSSGKSCVTGSKVYCCTTTVSSTSARLTIPIIVSGAKKCLDVVAPDQHNNGAQVQVWDCNTSLQQTWKIDGRAIKSGAGKCLDVVASDQHNNGARVQVWDCNNSLQQTWTIERQAIKSGAGKCLDVVAPDQFKNGGRVQVWDCNNSLQQSWMTP